MLKFTEHKYQEFVGKQTLTIHFMLKFTEYKYQKFVRK